MSLRNVLYCKVEPEHNQSGPKRPASHNCPPTLPRPPAMSPCSELNVRTLPPANIAPGAAGTNRQCTTQPSAMPPMPALPPPPSISCHEKHATDTTLRTFCNKTTSLAHFLHQNDTFCVLSVQNHPLPHPATRVHANILSRGEAKLFQSWANQAKTAHSIPYRYPVDTRFPKSSRPVCVTSGRFSKNCPFRWQPGRMPITL